MRNFKRNPSFCVSRAPRRKPSFVIFSRHARHYTHSAVTSFHLARLRTSKNSSLWKYIYGGKLNYDAAPHDVNFSHFWFHWALNCFLLLWLPFVVLLLIIKSSIKNKELSHEWRMLKKSFCVPRFSVSTLWTKCFSVNRAQNRWQKLKSLLLESELTRNSFIAC